VKPIYFKEVNYEYAKNQSEYLTLPSYRTKDGIVTSCWKLNLFERIKLLFNGKIFVSQMTFNRPLQPQKLALNKNIDKGE
jgi:hypothetical protein